MKRKNHLELKNLRYIVLSAAVLLLFNLYNFSFSQENYRFNKIGLKDGLPSGTAPLSFSQDFLGFIWFPILGGISKFDGFKFTAYKTFIDQKDTLYLPEIFCVFEDSQNELWAAGNNILGKYDRKKDIFNFYYIVDKNDNESVPSVYSIQEGKKGILWLSSYDKGLFSFDKNSNKFRQYNYEINNPNSINSDTLSDIVIDDNGAIWISFFAKGLCKFDPEKNQFTRFSRSNTQGNIFLSDSLHALFKDKAGKIWIAFRNRMIAELDPNNNDIKYHKIEGNNVNPSAIITKIFVDNSGMVWIGTYREGLILFNTETNTFTGIKNNENSNNAINYAYGIYQDRSGLVWIGDLEAIHTYSPNSQTFVNYSENEIFTKNIKNAGIQGVKSTNSNELWLATTNGLYKWYKNSNVFTHYLKDTNPKRDPKQFGNNSVSNVHFDSKGNLWAATYSGLYRFDTASMNYKLFKHNPDDSLSLGPDGPDNIYEDSHGNLWVSTDYSIDKFDRESEIFKHYKISTVRSFFEDSDGILWACSGSRGIYRYNRAADLFEEFYDEKSFRGFSMVQEDDNKNLWAASFYSGINYFDNTSFKYQSYSTESGLPSDFVNNLIKDNSGMLWLSTRLGISRFDPERKQFKNFGEDEGLKIRDFLTTSAFKATDGGIYMGGRNGLVSFYPAPLNTRQPNVVLTDFKIHNITVIPSDTSVLKQNINVAEEIELSYKNNSISFEFAALDFRDPAKNKYSYKMEGFDEDWSIPSADRTAGYTNLNAGEYVFAVKGSNDDGIWNENGAKVNIKINPPWWKTWWFTACWILFAGSLFGGTIRFVSVQKLKKKINIIKHQQAIEKERMRISKDMHDEVGSSLTRITLLSEIAKNKIGDYDEINKITKASREVVNNMDEIVWAINPKNDSLDNLAAYILQYAQEYFESTGIDCKFDFPENIPDVPLQSDVRHNIFLTVKESLNNIVKHSAASDVSIELKINLPRAEFMIKDNGKGIDFDHIDKFSNGLSNMRKRIEDINGEISIESEKGTCIRISIKVNEN